MIFGVACGTEQRDSPGSPSEFELNELSVGQLQDGMQSGRYTSRTARRAVPRAHLANRRGRAPPSIRHRDQPRRARDRRCPRRGAEGQGRTRTAAWHPGVDQRQHRYRRQDADNRGFPGAGGRACAARCLRGRTTARRRRRATGEDEPERVGQHSIDEVHERLERPRRPGEESLCARSQPVRIELGNRRRDRRQPRRGGCRHRNRWLGRLSLVCCRARRHQADDWTREPLRHHPDRTLAGHRGADDANGHGCRCAVERDGRCRPARPGDCVRSPRTGGLHRSTKGKCAAGRTHRGRTRAVFRIQRACRQPHRGSDCCE